MEGPIDINMIAPSNSKQNIPSKRTVESLGMIDVNVSAKLHMPIPEQQVDATEIQKIVTTFITKCNDCFFMSRKFKFDVNSCQWHLTPSKKCVRL